MYLDKESVILVYRRALDPEHNHCRRRHPCLALDNVRGAVARAGQAPETVPVCLRCLLVDFRRAATVYRV